MNDGADLALQLRDIHLPPPPSWWPPQPGWWLLAIVLLAAGLWLTMRPPAWKREALARLQEAEEKYATHGDAARLLADVSILLRACALLLKDRGQVAGLTGEAWLECLRELGRGVSPAPEEALINGPYREHTELDVGAFSRSVAAWIKRARRTRSAAS